MAINNIKNIGAIKYRYNVRPTMQDFVWHRLITQVNNKNIKRDFQSVFENFPDSFDNNFLVVDVTEFTESKGASFVLNGRPLNLNNQFGNCDYNLPIYSKLAKLTKEIFQSDRQFNCESFYLGSKSCEKNLEPYSIFELAEIYNPGTTDNYKNSLSVEKIHDFANVKKSAATINQLIQNHVMQYFNL